jgi:hypothetical protein
MSRDLEYLGSIGADPTEDRETRQRKALLVYLAVLILPGSLIWGTTSTWPRAVSALVAWSYLAVSVSSIGRLPSIAAGSTAGQRWRNVRHRYA